MIQVVDYGKGIPDEKKEAVFERFYCVDQSHTNKKHFGLGLSIAHEIIKLHNGELGINDTNPGDINPGTTFTITLDYL